MILRHFQCVQLLSALIMLLLLLKVVDVLSFDENHCVKCCSSEVRVRTSMQEFPGSKQSLLLTTVRPPLCVLFYFCLFLTPCVLCPRSPFWPHNSRCLKLTFSIPVLAHFDFVIAFISCIQNTASSDFLIICRSYKSLLFHWLYLIFLRFFRLR